MKKIWQDLIPASGNSFMQKKLLRPELIAWNLILLKCVSIPPHIPSGCFGYNRKNLDCIPTCRECQKKGYDRIVLQVLRIMSKTAREPKTPCVLLFCSATYPLFVSPIASPNISASLRLYIHVSNPQCTPLLDNMVLDRLRPVLFLFFIHGCLSPCVWYENM